MSIYEKTKTKVKDIFCAMIIQPKYIEIIEDGKIKRYKYDADIEHLKAYYARVIKIVKDMNYNQATKILKIFV